MEPIITFQKLPRDVLENIFQFLPYEDLLNCKNVLPELEEICDKFVLKSFYFVIDDICNCMDTLDNKINGSKLKFKEKRKLLRSFNVLENLKQSLELYLVLTRPDIGPNITPPLAQIFDTSKYIINLVMLFHI